MHGAPTPCGLAESAHTHFGVLEPFNKHRRYNNPICHQLSRDAETLDLAKAIGNCATSIGVEVPQDGPRAGEALLRAANPCNRRLCPFCEWRKSRAWRRRFFEGLPKFHEDFPTNHAIFLTLTVRNCRVDELGETLKHMHRSWNRMHQCAFFPTKFWFRRTEITSRDVQNPLIGKREFHPHTHAVLLVPAGYFSHGYVKQLEWQKQWMASARLDYVPVVDVRRARTKSSSGGHALEQSRTAAIEAAKYSTKATDLIAMGSSLGTYHYAIKSLRLSASSKSLKPYITDTPINSSELVDKETVDAEQTVRGKALWFEDIQEYLFSDLL